MKIKARQLILLPNSEPGYIIDNKGRIWYESIEGTWKLLELPDEPDTKETSI